MRETKNGADQMSKAIAISAGVAVVALVGGALAMSSIFAPADRFAACRASQVAGGDIGGPFTLVDENGVTVTDQDVITGPTLVYFGYTFCPDVCPLDNMRNALAIHELDERGVEVTPVFISIDPARDTPELLKGFTDNFHERMIGLSGTEEQVAGASRAYRTYFAKQDSDDPDYYLMDHTTMSYLVFPEYGFVEFFRRDVTPEDMADRLECFVEAS